MNKEQLEVLSDFNDLEFVYVCQVANKIIDTIDDYKISYKEIWRQLNSHHDTFKKFEQNMASSRLKYFKEEDSGKTMREFLESYSASQISE